MTAISVIAAKYGVSAVIGALTGNEGLGGLGSELMGALMESEDRIAEQLDGISRKLDRVLAQRYSTALGAGQRTLLDASTAPDAQTRVAELSRARDLFLEAGAAALSPLQLAVAERYVALCYIALGRREAAGTALKAMDRAAAEAMLDAAAEAGPPAYERARKQLGWSGRVGSRSRRDDLLEDQAGDIILAALREAELAEELFRESRTLAQGMGLPLVPLPHQEELPPEPDGEDDPLRTAKLQLVLRPAAPGPVRYGPITVTWRKVLIQPIAWPVPHGRTSASMSEVRQYLESCSISPDQVDGDALRRLRRRMYQTAVAWLEVDVTIKVEPAFTRNRIIGLASRSTEPSPAAGWVDFHLRGLAAGRSELTIKSSIPFSLQGKEMPDESYTPDLISIPEGLTNEIALSVDNTLIFPSA
ncbi:hypothetical protein SAMN04489732_112201 [Amycolatopsis saalfeldensis]|uniref:Uncharacterized protein n=1 Tax=Amycolatopsis saalfeldensis TaxID=394193 RepID=A0A1H8Y9X5_9PSEU|nr:hypothetical protein SAMN04489732_112201 [Amycolatopsis saalfeldensis]